MSPRISEVAHIGSNDLLLRMHTPPPPPTVSFDDEEEEEAETTGVDEPLPLHCSPAATRKLMKQTDALLTAVAGIGNSIIELSKEKKKRDLRDVEPKNGNKGREEIKSSGLDKQQPKRRRALVYNTKNDESIKVKDRQHSSSSVEEAKKQQEQWLSSYDEYRNVVKSAAAASNSFITVEQHESTVSPRHIHQHTHHHYYPYYYPSHHHHYPPGAPPHHAPMTGPSPYHPYGYYYPPLPADAIAASSHYPHVVPPHHHMQPIPPPTPFPPPSYHEFSLQNAKPSLSE